MVLKLQFSLHYFILSDKMINIPILKQWIFYNCNMQMAGINHIADANCKNVYTAYIKLEDIFINQLIINSTEKKVHTWIHQASNKSCLGIF